MARRLWIAGLLGAFVAACATSHVENSWTDPTVAGKPLEFSNMITIAMLDEGAMRRVAEDTLTRAIQSGPRGQSGAITATPGYQVLEASDLADSDKARAKVTAGGFDGVIVVSVVDSRERIRTTPGVGVGGGYHRGWGTVYSSSMDVRSDTIVRIQTNIYSVESGKLVWSGTSKTLNPRDVSDLIDDTVQDVGAALREQGLVR